MVKELLNKITNRNDTSSSNGGDPEEAPTPPAENIQARLDALAHSKPNQFIALLEANDGRMKQAEIVAQTEWSAPTVSRVLSEMESDGLVRKTAVGRENVVSLARSGRPGYLPPEPAADDIVDDPAGRADGSTRPILIVEDRPTEARLRREAFQEAGILAPVHVVQEGSDAVAFLLQRGPYTDAPRPGLILLDLALVTIDELSALAELCERDDLAGMPLLVVSRSPTPDDVRKAYAHGATAYLTRPHTFEEHVTMAEAICDFWFRHALSPRDPAVSKSG